MKMCLIVMKMSKCKTKSINGLNNWLNLIYVKCIFLFSILFFFVSTNHLICVKEPKDYQEKH